MSRRIIASSPEDIQNTRVGESLVQSLSSASRPRIFDHVSQPTRVALETGLEDSGESQYHFTSPSNRMALQAFPTNTAIHLYPLGINHHPETQGQKKGPEYEITQNSVKFRGNVKGIKIVATQVASNTGLFTSEDDQPEDEEQENQPQGQGKQDSGFVNQSGAIFFKSVADSHAEVSQSVKDFYHVTQDAVEVEGEATECSFNNNQRVW